ncbi:MAG: hypothetical protein ACRCTA_00725 [Bacilli bacterium]
MALTLIIRNSIDSKYIKKGDKSLLGRRNYSADLILCNSEYNISSIYINKSSLYINDLRVVDNVVLLAYIESDEIITLFNMFEYAYYHIINNEYNRNILINYQVVFSEKPFLDTEYYKKEEPPLEIKRFHKLLTNNMMYQTLWFFSLITLFIGMIISLFSK